MSRGLLVIPIQNSKFKIQNEESRDETWVWECVSVAFFFKIGIRYLVEHYHVYPTLKGLRPLRLPVVRQMPQVGKPAHGTGSSV